VKEEILQFVALRSSYDCVMNSIEMITKNFEKLLKEVGEESLISRNGYGDKNFRLLQDRAKSELLSIAFFGAFSSGKSFLISGLNQKVDWYERDGRDQFAPLLPTSPRHTSNCPVAVEPVVSGRADEFAVLFEGSDIWEQKNPAIAIIQAYVTDLPNAVSQRLTNKDRTRTVRTARIGISSAIMKARLYDLPGFGAIGANYEGVIRNFVQQADCITYVACAIKPLDERDVELLRDVYTHHKLTGKPVFFVLTQIDRAWDIDAGSGKIQWEEVRDANNEFLEQNFLVEGRADSTFIGEGFIPVSPALEAKGIALSAQSHENSQRYIVDSGMALLRERFDDYLQNTSGPMHLAELASEAQRLLLRLSHDMQQRYLSESTLVTEAKNTIIGYKAQRRILIDKKTMVEKELRELGQVAIRRAFAGSDPDDLVAFLKEKLNEKIKVSDVLKEKEIHQIETEKVILVREWMSRSSKSLIPRWASSWESFYRQTNEIVNHLLEEALTAQQKAVEENSKEEVDITAAKVEERLASKYEDMKTKTFKDTIDLMSKTWGTWTVLAGVGAATSLPQVVALLGVGSTPVGLGILATALIGSAYGRYKLVKQRDERREMMMTEFPEYAQKIVREYRVQADEFINSRVGFLVEIIDNEIDALSNSIDSLEQRLKEGEYLNKNKRLENLDSLIQRCREVNAQIDEFYASVANTRTDMQNALMLNAGS
jgi:hypothetical protein